MQEVTLINSLKEMSFQKNGLFAISCVERTIDLYSKFEDEIALEHDEYFNTFKHGHEKLLYLLNVSYKILIGELQTNNQEIINYFEQCLELAPDTEMISSPYTVMAQNCAIGMSYVFQYFQDKKIESVLYSRDKLLETIDNVHFFLGYEVEKSIQKLNEELLLEMQFLNLIKNLQEPLQNNDMSISIEFNQNNKISF